MTPHLLLNILFVARRAQSVDVIFFNTLVRGETPKLMSTKFDLKKLETSLYHSAVRCLEPFRRGSRV